MIRTRDSRGSNVGTRFAADESPAVGRRYAARRAAVGSVGSHTVKAFAGSRAGAPRRRLLKNARLGAVVGMVGASLVLAGLAAQPAHADTGTGVETVGVQMGWDQAVYSISSVVTTGKDDATPSTARYSMAPSEQNRLPVRVRLSYQAGSQSGTDLSGLKGYTGPLLIRLTVENVTVTPQELSFESQGARYRSYGLVGAPYTVVASAELGAGTLSQVVTTGIGQPLTDGVVSQGDNDAAQVLWTAILAPPASAPSAVFTLSIDATDFQPPQFSVTVEPGIITNPSLIGVVGGGQADNSQAVQLMLGAQQTVSEASDLVTQVQKTLAMDANTVGARTYGELSASSATTLAELSALTSQMRAMSSSVSGDLNDASSSFNSSLALVFADIETNVLGDPDPDTTVPMTAAAVDNCTFTLPTLAPDQPKTVSSTLKVLKAQADLLAEAFADQGVTAVVPDCRAALIAQIVKSIGASPVDPTIDCASGGVQADSLWCSIYLAQENLSANTSTASASRHDVDSFVTALDGSTLVNAATALQSDLSSLHTGAGGVITFDQSALTGMKKQLDNVKNALDDATTRLSEIKGLADAAASSNPVMDYVLTEAASDSACAAAIGTLTGVDALNVLATASDCSSFADLATAVKEDQTQWSVVSSKADIAGAAASPGPDYASADANLAAILANLQADLAALAGSPSPTVTLSMIYNDSSVMPVDNVENACAAVAAASALGSTPLPSANALFAAINSWLCTNNGLDTAISAYESQTDTAIGSASSHLALLTTQVEQASFVATGGINKLSDDLHSFFAEQQHPAILELQKSLSKNFVTLQTKQKDTQTVLQEDVQSVVTSLQTQVDAATLNATNTATSLQTNFKNLMIDLGDPRSAAPTGLIGSLKTTSTTVQSVADQLMSLGVTIGGNVTSQQLAAQNAALQSAQLASGQQILDNAPYFCGQPKPANGVSIYSFHIGEA